MNDGLDPTNPLYWREEAETIADNFAPTPNQIKPHNLHDAGFVAKLLALVAGGNYPSTACRILRISPTNSDNWRAAAEKGDERYLSYLSAVEKAEAISESSLFASVIAAGSDPKYWTSRAWALERRFGERFAKRDSLLLDHRVSGSVEHVHKLGKPQQDQDYKRIVDYLLRPELEEPTVDAEFEEVQDEGQLPE